MVCSAFKQSPLQPIAQSLGHTHAGSRIEYEQHPKPRSKTFALRLGANPTRFATRLPHSGGAASTDPVRSIESAAFLRLRFHSSVL